MKRILSVTLLALPLLAASFASAQTTRTGIAVKARVGSGAGLGVEAEIPLNSNWRVTAGVTQDKIIGGAKYFLPGNNYVAGTVGFTRGGLTNVNALVGHRFETQSVFFDVEGGLNFKQFGPVIGASVGIRL